METLFQRLFSRKSLRPATRKAARRPIRNRPRLEHLEDRLAPATHEWTGLGLDGNFATSTNWTNGNPINDPGGALVFHTNLLKGPLTLTNNEPTSLTVGSITFDANAGSVAGTANGGVTNTGYTINGNTILLGAGGITVVNGVTNFIGLTETFNAGLTLTANSFLTVNDPNVHWVNGGGIGGAFTFVVTNTNAGGVTNPNGTSVDLNGAVSVTTLQKEGVGTLKLTNANSQTTNNFGTGTGAAGAIIVTNASGLGSTTGTTSVFGANANTAARLILRNGITVQQATFNLDSNANGGALSGDDGTTVTYTGSVVGNTDNAHNSVALGATGANTRVIINGVISDTNPIAFLSINGDGTLEFTKNNTYHGVTLLNGVMGSGVLQIDSPAGLGLGGAGNDTQETAAGTEILLAFTGNLADSGGAGAAENLTLMGSGPNGLGALQVLGVFSPTVAGTVALAGNTTIGVGTGTLTFPATAVISGGFNLTYDEDVTTAGSQGTIITQAANTYSGDTTIGNPLASPVANQTGVTLNIQNNASFGASAGATVTVESGSSLQLQGGITIPQNIVFLAPPAQASGVAPFSAANGATGQLDSVSGANTMSGVITLNEQPTVQTQMAVDAGSLILSGAIQGPNNFPGTGGGIVKVAPGILQLQGPVTNTYSGTTTVLAGSLALNKSGGADVAIPLNTSLIIGAPPVNGFGADVLALVFEGSLVGGGAQLNDNEIAPNVLLTINPNGVLDTNSFGFKQTLPGFTMIGGLITSAASQGNLLLTGDVNATSGRFVDAGVAIVQTAEIDFNNLKWNGTRTFNVAKGPAAVDFELSNTTSISDGTSSAALTKTGAGRMRIDGFNSYTGLTTISGGILEADNNHALGQNPDETPAGAGITVAPGATLAIDAGVTLGDGTKVLTLNGAGAGGAASDPGALEGVGNQDNTAATAASYNGPIVLAGAGQNTIGADGARTNALPLGSIGNSASGTIPFYNDFEAPDTPPTVAGAVSFPSVTLTLPGAISGPGGGLTVFGGGAVVESGTPANTYGGPTIVNAGTTLELDRINGGVPQPAMPAGSVLTVNGTVQVDVGSFVNGFDIPANDTVNVGATGVFRLLNGVQQTIAALNGLAGGLVDLTQGGAAELSVTGAIGISGAGTFAVNGAGSSTGQFITNGNAVAIASGSTLNLHVGLSGAGLTENGADATATMMFSGTAQNLEGNVTVNSGALLLAKTAASATAGSSIGVGSTLTIGNGTGAAGSVVVRDSVTPVAGANNWQLGGIISGAVNVVINTDGVLDLNGHFDRVNNLTMSGGVVALGGGQLDVNGTVMANSGASTAVITNGTLLMQDGQTGVNTPGAGVFTGAGNLTVTAVVAGTTLTKSGSGTLTLTGNNTYTGATSVNGGKLFVNGSQPQSVVNVNAPGTLGGSGTVGTVTVGPGGTLAPGSSAGAPGVLSVQGDVTLQSGSSLNVLLNSTTPGTGFSQLNAAGTVNISPNTTLNITVNAAFPANTSFTVIQAGSVTPAPATFANESGAGNVVSLNDGTFHVTATGNSVTLTAVAATTTTDVVASPLNPAFEQPVTLTATVTFPAGTASPGGTVQFFDNGIPIGAAQAVNPVFIPASATATVTIGVPSFSVGTHIITAVYSGDANNAGSSSLADADDTVVVHKAGTLETITSPTSPVSVFFGQSITVSATVSVTEGSGSPVAPTGFVDFKATNTVTNQVIDLGNVALNGTSASTSVSTLAAGTWTFTATYLGDGNFAASAASAPSAVATVNPAVTTTALVAAPNPGAVGSPVTFTVTVTNTSDSVPPSGPVEIFDGATDLGPATFVGTNANQSTYTVPFTLAAGVHSITAKFNLTGTTNPNFVGSTSNMVSEVIQPAVADFVLNSSGSLSTVSPVNGVQPLATSPGPGAVFQISAVTDSSGQAVLYAISQGTGNLWEHTGSGWTEISSGIFQSISAATNAQGQAVVFGIISKSSPAVPETLWEQDPSRGTGLDAGWIEASPGVFSAVSAVGTSGGAVAYAVISPTNPLFNGTLWHYSAASNSWFEASSGFFTSISAGLNGSGQAVVFGVVFGGSMWEQNPSSGLNTGWQQLSGTGGLPASFLSVAAEAHGADTLFAIASDHSVWEHTLASNTKISAALAAAQVSATRTPAGTDEVFMALTDGELWEFSSGPGGSGLQQLLAGGVAATSAP